MLPAIEPVLPSKFYRDIEAVLADPAEYSFEQKYDGFRCIPRMEGGRVTLQTKKGLHHNGFNEIAEELAGWGLKSAILDGELVCLNDQGDPNFTALMRRQLPVSLAVFDLLYLEGLDLRILPLLERQAYLHRLLPRPRGHIFPVTSFEATEASKLIQLMQKRKWEGLIAKQKTSTYDPQQRDIWVKLLNPKYTHASSRWRWFQDRKT